MKRARLYITICLEDDRFSKLHVEESVEEGYYDVNINTLLYEPLISFVTDENNIKEVENHIQQTFCYDDFKNMFPFCHFVLANCRKPGFFTNADTVYINGIYEDIVQYLKMNPELLDKELILSEVLDLDKNTCVRIKEVFKDFPNLKLTVVGNNGVVSISEYERTIDAIDSIVAKIKVYDYSPLEQLILAYDLIRDRFYAKEDDGDEYTVSRDLTSALLGDKIVCFGFANIFAAVCRKLNIKNDIFLLDSRIEANPGHARNMIYLYDDKYDIDGLYFFDPTFDCKKDDNYDFLLSYRFFAKDYSEMDVLSGNQFIPTDLKLFDEKYFEQMISRCEEMGRDIGKALKIIADYRMSYLLKFIDEETINPLSPDYDPKELINEAFFIKTLSENSIGAETFLKALYVVRKNQYYENPAKYVFDVGALTNIIANSRFRVDDGAEFTLLSILGFNHYYGKKGSEEKVKKFIEKNGLDIDIERTKLTRTLRTVLENKIEEEKKAKNYK